MSTILFAIGLYLLTGGTITIALYYNNPFISNKDGLESLFVAILWPYFLIKYITERFGK